MVQVIAKQHVVLNVEHMMNVIWSLNKDVSKLYQ